MQIYRAVDELEVLGLVRHEYSGLSLTADGMLASELALDPPLARMLMSARDSSYPFEVVKLVAVWKVRSETRT